MNKQKCFTAKKLAVVMVLLLLLTPSVSFAQTVNSNQVTLLRQLLSLLTQELQALQSQVSTVQITQKTELSQYPIATCDDRPAITYQAYDMDSKSKIGAPNQQYYNIFYYQSLVFTVTATSSCPSSIWQVAMTSDPKTTLSYAVPKSYGGYQAAIGLVGDNGNTYVEAHGVTIPVTFYATDGTTTATASSTVNVEPKQ